MWCEFRAARIAVAVALAWVVHPGDAAEARDVHPTAAVRRTGDHTLLSWRDGPPYITNARPDDMGSAGYSSERRVLRWENVDVVRRVLEQGG